MANRPCFTTAFGLDPPWRPDLLGPPVEVAAHIRLKVAGPLPIPHAKELSLVRSGVGRTSIGMLQYKRRRASYSSSSSSTHFAFCSPIQRRLPLPYALVYRRFDGEMPEPCLDKC